MLHYSVLFGLMALLAGVPAVLHPWAELPLVAQGTMQGLTLGLLLLFVGLALATAAGALLNRR